MDRAAGFLPADLLALYPVLASLAPDEMAAICTPRVMAIIPEGAELFAERQPCQGFPGIRIIGWTEPDFSLELA